VNKIWEVLTCCLDDYTTDSRGDVGSWIRIAATESLISVYVFVYQNDVKVTIGKLLRLSVERMDRVRTFAGRTLRAIIPMSNQDSLKTFIQRYVSARKSDYNNSCDDETFTVPSKVYPTVVKLLSLETYRQEILTGFLASAGGLGESLVLV